MRKAVVICVALIVLLITVASGPPPAVAADLTVPVAGRVSVELITSDAAFSNTLAVTTAGVGVAASGCNLEPAGGLAGVHVLSEKISQHGCRVELDADTTAPGIQGFAANAKIEFGMCAQTDSDDACEYLWSSDPSENSDNFDHVRTTELSTGVFQLAWEDKPEGGDEDFNDLIVVVRVHADNDGDGLWDDWEQSGIDTNADGTIDLNLPAAGADPDRQDIFLEIDYMDCGVAGGDCPAGDSHDHRPKATAVQAVVDVFANAPIANPDGSTGITLHIDVDDAIPHQNFMSIGCKFSTTAFDTLKADPAYFGPTNPRRFAYHYAVFAHRQGANSTSSGCGEQPGNDFIITLGEWNTACIGNGGDGTLDTTPAGDDVAVDNSVIFTGPNLVCDTTADPADVQWIASGNSPAADLDGDGLDDRSVGTVQHQAGTLMHEFGHNLSLDHGGDSGVNRKPNYLSIMNYAFQTRGIAPTDPDGAGPLNFRLDFSDGALGPLDETNLSEPAGIGDGADMTRYFCPDGSGNTGPGTGAIDWNCDGDGGTDTGISVNINNDADEDTNVPIVGTLTDYNDWAGLKLDFQNSRNFEDGLHQTTEDIVEIDFPTHLEVPLGIEIAIKPEMNPNAVNTRGRGVIPVAICNGGAVVNSVAISDPADPGGFSSPATNVVVETIRFTAENGSAPAHDLADPLILGDHLTTFVDTNADSVPDTLTAMDAPDCPGAPAGPDLIVHFPVRESGLAPGDTEVCLTAQLSDGSTIIGCDSVEIVR